MHSHVKTKIIHKELQNHRLANVSSCCNTHARTLTAFLHVLLSLLMRKGALLCGGTLTEVSAVPVDGGAMIPSSPPHWDVRGEESMQMPPDGET